MGTELELKLHLDGAQQLEAVLCWPKLDTIRVGAPYELRMETSYFDTVGGDFSARRWTVRRRLENGVSVICVKTPREKGALLRGEWETEADSLTDALPTLLEQGAPEELASLVTQELVKVCGARFLRRAQLLEPEPGVRLELAADAGVLLGGGRELPFYELELEHKAGDAEGLFRFGRTLAAEFGLSPEPKSKFARARRL